MRLYVQIHRDMKGKHRICKLMISESFLESVKNSVMGLNSGDFIIANHVSYVELLYLAFRYSPVFATIVHDEQLKGPKVVCQGILGALLHATIGTSLADSKGEKLEDIVRKAKQKHWGPVVLFPEGCTTNGRAILVFQNVLTGLNAVLKETNTRIHLMTFR